MFLVAAMMLTGVFALGAPSAYAVGCYGDTCYNKGPVAMGCTKDQRLISDPAWGGSLQVLYSPACRAAWAASDWMPNWNCFTLQIERARSNLIVQARLGVEFCPGEAREWTNMFPGGWYFRAVANRSSSGGGSSDYTAWVFR
jgi:hypothetical protein